MPAGKDLNESVAIFTVDPGTTSGCARGIFPTSTESVWEGVAAGQLESWEVEGIPSRQAWEIMDQYSESIGWPHTSIDPRWYLVFEGFAIRLGPGASSKRELLDPVRVSEGCETLSWLRNGMRWAHIEYQQASSAKNFATDKRLRTHGLWVPGSAHRRDAVRHLVTKYANLIGEL